MINVLDKTNCSGCGACRDVCPTCAITMMSDDEGFLYPNVNVEKCIKCGKCLKACPIKTPVQAKHRVTKKAYAAMNLDEEIRMKSSSGGIFWELAETILNCGGVVFGAAMDAHHKVKHIAVYDIAELGALQGSKYVQSEIGDTYKKAKELLTEGKNVLFTGTPCQIAGLYGYLGVNCDNLITVDIICHGVPSPFVWDKYIEFCETVSGAKTKRIFFRQKEEGWRRFSILFAFSNNTEYRQNLHQDLFMRGFLKNIFLRPSCSACTFKGTNRLSDITLADFWGIEKIAPELDDDKGTSLVIINSDKGEGLFGEILPCLKSKETDFEQAIKYNSAYFSSVSQDTKRDEFMLEIKEKGFRGVVKYVKLPISERIKKKIKLLIKKLIQNRKGSKKI